MTENEQLENMRRYLRIMQEQRAKFDEECKIMLKRIQAHREKTGL